MSKAGVPLLLFLLCVAADGVDGLPPELLQSGAMALESVESTAAAGG
jgi:hypothetical protein